MTIDGMIARILVPTDFSSGSQRAWTMAQRLAAPLGAELVLVHVLAQTPVDLAPRFAREEARAQERAAQAEHQLGIPRGTEEEEGPLPTVFTSPFSAEGLREFSEIGREWARKLEQWAEAGRARGCKVTTMLRVGTPYREVLAAAADTQADLVLLATHGRGEIHRLLVGSVADKVIRMAPCPVLTVKEG